MPKPFNYSLYALVDPRTEDVRYIGISYAPSSRLRGHFDFKQPKTHKEKWLAELKREGLLPVLTILCDSLTKEQASNLEIETIKEYRLAGAHLTNGTDGGIGGNPMLGRRASEETRRKLSLARMGNRNLAGHQIWLGRRHTQESKVKMSVARIGNQNALGFKHSEEVRARMSEGQLRRQAIVRELRNA